MAIFGKSKVEQYKDSNESLKNAALLMDVAKRGLINILGSYGEVDTALQLVIMTLLERHESNRTKRSKIAGDILGGYRSVLDKEALTALGISDGEPLDELLEELNKLLDKRREFTSKLGLTEKTKLASTNPNFVSSKKLKSELKIAQRIANEFFDSAYKGDKKELSSKKESTYKLFRDILRMAEKQKSISDKNRGFLKSFECFEYQVSRTAVVKIEEEIKQVRNKLNQLKAGLGSAEQGKLRVEANLASAEEGQIEALQSELEAAKIKCSDAAAHLTVAKEEFLPLENKRLSLVTKVALEYLDIYKNKDKNKSGKKTFLEKQGMSKRADGNDDSVFDDTLVSNYQQLYDLSLTCSADQKKSQAFHEAQLALAKISSVQTVSELRPDLLKSVNEVPALLEKAKDAANIYQPMLDALAFFQKNGQPKKAAEMHEALRETAFTEANKHEIDAFKAKQAEVLEALRLTHAEESRNNETVIVRESVGTDSFEMGTEIAPGTDKDTQGKAIEKRLSKQAVALKKYEKNQDKRLRSGNKVLSAHFVERLTSFMDLSNFSQMRTFEGVLRQIPTKHRSPFVNAVLKFKPSDTPGTILDRMVSLRKEDARKGTTVTEQEKAYYSDLLMHNAKGRYYNVTSGRGDYSVELRKAKIFAKESAEFATDPTQALRALRFLVKTYSKKGRYDVPKVERAQCLALLEQHKEYIGDNNKDLTAFQMLLKVEEKQATAPKKGLLGYVFGRGKAARAAHATALKDLVTTTEAYLKANFSVGELDLTDSIKRGFELRIVGADRSAQILVIKECRDAIVQGKDQLAKQLVGKILEYKYSGLSPSDICATLSQAFGDDEVARSAFEAAFAAAIEKDKGLGKAEDTAVEETAFYERISGLVGDEVHPDARSGAIKDAAKNAAILANKKLSGDRSVEQATEFLDNLFDGKRASGELKEAVKAIYLQELGFGKEEAPKAPPRGKDFAANWLNSKLNRAISVLKKNADDVEALKEAVFAINKITDRTKQDKNEFLEGFFADHEVDASLQEKIRRKAKVPPKLPDRKPKEGGGTETTKLAFLGEIEGGRGGLNKLAVLNNGEGGGSKEENVNPFIAGIAARAAAMKASRENRGGIEAQIEANKKEDVLRRESIAPDDLKGALRRKLEERRDGMGYYDDDEDQELDDDHDSLFDRDDEYQGDLNKKQQQKETMPSGLLAILQNATAMEMINRSRERELNNEDKTVIDDGWGLDGEEKTKEEVTTDPKKATTPENDGKIGGGLTFLQRRELLVKNLGGGGRE